MLLMKLFVYILRKIIFINKPKIHAVIILAVLITGSAFLGIIGLFIAVPIYIIISEIIYFYKLRLKKTY